MLKFTGLDTTYPVAQGGNRKRIHLDGAASPLACDVAQEAITTLLPHYSNTHSYVHTSAKISTYALNWAHQKILDVFNAKHDVYTTIFSGAGCTASINRVARGLAQSRSNKNVVLVSSMEHHANDLPHRSIGNTIEYLPLEGEGVNQGIIDLVATQALLEKHQGKVNYIAISSVSNVTGVINPVSEITKLAHQYDALVLVDAAQSVAHMPLDLSTETAPDFVVFSGHKLYSPLSPGVLVAKKEILNTMPGQDLGGGSVEDVTYQDFIMLDDYPDREESGTPNILGGIALAKVMKSLDEIGFESIYQHDSQLLEKLRIKLSGMNNIQVYADPALPRIGAISFNHLEIDHGLLSAILNDYFCIAVRNGCFCAHPYVSSMLKNELWNIDLSEIPDDQQQAVVNRKRGMVRASISLYNTDEDVEKLMDALIQIDRDINEYQDCYEAQFDGSYRHKTFHPNWNEKWHSLLDD